MAKLKTIKKNKEYRKVFNNGISVVNDKLVLIALKNKGETTRFGFSVSKRIGNAVKRNRLRRLFKEICRINIDSFKPGYDYVIIARKKSSNCDFYKIKYNILKLLQKLNKKIS